MPNVYLVTFDSVFELEDGTFVIEVYVVAPTIPDAAARAAKAYPSAGLTGVVQVNRNSSRVLSGECQ